MYSQRNMKIHLFFFLLVVAGGFYFQIEVIEWLFLMYAVFSVLIAEMLNTAIEVTVDLVTKKKCMRAMLSKDVAAGSVLLAVIQSVIIGGIIFYNRLIHCWLS